MKQKKPPFECFTRRPSSPEETAKKNTPEGIYNRVHKLLSNWGDLAERSLDSDNPGAVADADSILNQINILKVHYLNGEHLSPQEARELFLVATYLGACVFNLRMRPYGSPFKVIQNILYNITIFG